MASAEKHARKIFQSDETCHDGPLQVGSACPKGENTVVGTVLVFLWPPCDVSWQSDEVSGGCGVSRIHTTEH